jgi:hypothetical protein
MNTHYSDVPWIDPNHVTNREKIPPEVLDQYAGQHIAYSWDGTRVLAGAMELKDLYRKLEEMGQDTNHVVYSYVDDM